ncbi:DNA helicase/exodeoxyribonuclease V, gamma subunit [Cnuella takakiae]|uniref:RecBCD enzyme subunit RecC n=1 Tax=Cnuella takakiae TaxID=1302690 RepID=A0A1M5J4M3_9BACT|nr:exodeoxyribonuclease V subunit gamma [Cnuella takakiae]OLY91449.1 exodeoxyribonuclease V subunit gamma [Cnuella takakiae]SHG35461.1 DNA helicase/exodeoxyribonuclease V, gamma subunit [Cnuella takakiae]
MAFKLFVSNTLKPLAQRWRKTLRDSKASVFQPYYTITQTEGMNNWLRMQLAEDMEGIAANSVFLKPNDLLFKVSTLLTSQQLPACTSDHLCWLLFQQLGEPAFINAFPAISAYYTAEGGMDATRRLALATKTADLFDQYQVYRPGMVAGWKGARGLPPMEAWQQYLWEQVRRITEPRFTNKLQTAEAILEALKEPGRGELLRSRMPLVTMFGISITTQYHYNILKALAVHIDIVFFMLNPAPEVYWFDTVSPRQKALMMEKGKGVRYADSFAEGNALLTSWGKVVKDTFIQLFENDELLNSCEEVGITEPGNATLLQQVQLDIFNNSTGEDRTERIETALLKDGSITVNACYSMAREVEVLYNYLVHLVDQRRQELSPRDIVVMVSDIDTYAPYIRAVFENAPHRFPIRIADEGFGGSDNLVQALQQLLLLDEASFKAEQVLQLLDSSFIRNRFGLTNIPLLRMVVERANIRFGIHGDTELDTVFVSWAYGIKRILLGFCMGDEAAYAFGADELYPVDLVEGGEAQELVRFCHFIQVLIDAVEERKEERTLSGWSDYVRQLLRNCVATDEQATEEDYQVVSRQINRCNELAGLYPGNLSYAVFLQYFSGGLAAASQPTHFASGGITFCSLIPMRSIPFKVVAMLGLNFDKFPRREVLASFNLIDGRQRGDRNVKDHDKHLFLETICSAQQWLYISYIGQSVKDNTHLPPSALVDELLDYLESIAEEPEEVRQQLVCRHPLHGFSRKYSCGDEKYYSYLLEEQAGKQGLFNPDKQLPLLQIETVLLDDLLAFVKNPFRTYYQRVLNIRYREEEVLLPETELFDLDHLGQWQFKNELLHADAGEWPQLKTRAVKTGALPLRHMSDVLLQEVQEPVSQLRHLLTQCVGDVQPQRVAFNITLDGTSIQGSVELYAGKLVYTCFSRPSIKHQLAAYVQYLAARAAGLATGCFFITPETACAGVDISRETAEQRLVTLLHLYRKGHEQIIAFHPEVKVNARLLADFKEDYFFKELKRKIEDFNYPLDDAYVCQEYACDFTQVEHSAHYRDRCAVLVEPLFQFFPDLNE